MEADCDAKYVCEDCEEKWRKIVLVAGMLLVQSTQSSQLQPTRLPPIMLVKVGSERLSWLNTWWHWSAYRGYFQVIEWIQQPTDINALREFEVWKKKCDVKVRKFLPFNFHQQITILSIPGTTLLFPSQPLPPHNQRTAGGNVEAPHLRRVSQ